jgi:hypothetical protein
MVLEDGLLLCYYRGRCLQIVNMVKAKQKNLSKFKHIVTGIQERMCLLRSCMIEYVKRDTNSTAHGLAKEAVKYVIDNVWLE